MKVKCITINFLFTVFKQASENIMVVYSVFSQSVSFKYKTYFCSKATLILIITSSLTLIFPLIFTYRSHGFWLRSDTYIEQPDVSFKHDYVLIVGTHDQEKLIMCSNLQHLAIVLNGVNYCPVIKGKEIDRNRDGLKDSLYFSSEIAFPPELDIFEITLLLFFDYKLSGLCRVNIEAMGVVRESVGGRGRGSLEVEADLTLVQRRPLSPASPVSASRHNASASPFHLPTIMHQYSLDNVSARLSNEYATWGYGRVASEPFLLTVNVQYADATVRYTPLPSQVLKFAWMQFFPVLVISMLVFRAVKNFIFSNQLVYTYKEVPWEGKN